MKSFLIYKTKSRINFDKSCTPGIDLLAPSDILFLLLLFLTFGAKKSWTS